MSPTTQVSPTPLNAPVRFLLQAVAVVCVIFALVGIVIPVLPTVPFLLVAAWAASRSSPRLDAWLHDHPRFGHLLRDWRDGGVVPRRAKWLATAMMAVSAGFLVAMVRPAWVAAVAVTVLACVLAWLWRRPERPLGA